MNCLFNNIGQVPKALLAVLLLALLLPVSAGAENGGILAASPPAWSVNPDDYEFNMNMVVRLNYSGVPNNAGGNMIAAFVGNELRGVATPVVIGGSAYFFLTIYANQYKGEAVHFKAYIAAEDAVYPAFEEVEFIHNLFIGNSETPFWVHVDPNADFPPELEPVLADTTLVSIPFDPINLPDYTVSFDGDPVTWSAQPGPNLNAALVNGVLTVSSILPGWIGTDSVRIIVTENTANQLADTITAWFTQLPDYGPPVWQTIPGQTIFQGEAFMPFDLDDYLVFNGPCRGFDFDVYPFTGSVADPAWPAVVPGSQPMSIVARPLFADVQLAGAGARLAAFVNGVLAGWATPTGVAPNVTYSLSLKNVGAGNISFKFYDAGHQYLYEENTTLVFVAGGSVGTLSAPYLIQLSPLIPTLAVNGQVQIAIDDPSWLGSYPIDFIVWDCDYPNLRRDTFQAIFSVITDIRPEITSPATVSFEENACSTLYDTQTADPNNGEGSGLTYTLAGGTDVNRFAIDAQTGILSWAIGFSPDFEAPVDADANNQYEVKIRVTNAASLSDTLELTVTVTNQATEPFTAAINGGTGLICTNGSATLQAAGGVSYVWSTGSTLSSIIVNSPGTYTVTVTSTGACTAIASVLIAPQPAITAAGSSTPVCVGAPIQLSSAPSGGTTPYIAFNWSGPNSFSANVEDPAAFPALPASAGVYGVTLTDGAGCTASATTTLAVSGSSAPSISATSNSPVCEGASIALSSTPSGGSGSGYTFLWAGPNNYAAVGQNPAAFTAVPAAMGMYSVTVTDNAGCTGTGSTAVTVNPQPLATASSNSPVSVGANILLSAAASGGSGAGYAYAWSGPNNYIGTGAQPTPFSATMAASGVYTVTVTDGAGCSGTATTTVSVVACPVISASSAGAACVGGTIVLQSTPMGGALPYASFAWSGPNSYTSNLEDPVAFPAATGANGQYSVTVTDNLGCTAVASTTVTVYDSPGIAATNNTPVCQGANVVLNATPSGGSGTYVSYQWIGPDYFSATQEDPAPFTGTPASSGSYGVTVTDSHGCTASTTTVVTVSAMPQLTASNNGPLCIGANLNLQATVSGGSGGYIFNWSGPAFSSNLEDPVISPVAIVNAGFYYVTATDNSGCSAMANTIVSVSNDNAPGITAFSNSPICAGNFLSLSSTPTGGTMPYTAFSWSGPNGYTASQEDPVQFIANQNFSGQYTVTVTDFNNCKGAATISVSVFSPTLNPTSNSPVCPGATLQLYSGGQGGAGVSYNWSGPNGFSSFQSDPSIPGAGTAATGTYYVTINDNGCIGTSSISVSVSDAVPPVIVCPPSTTLSADGNCSSLLGAYAAVSVNDNCAANPAVTQSPAASTVLTGHNDIETVTLTANDGNGNTAFCTFTVTLKDMTPPTVVCPSNTTLAADASCSSLLGAWTAVSVSDNCAVNPAVLQSPVASTVLSGHNDAETVTLTANDGNGNTALCTFTVTLKDVAPPVIVCPSNTTLAADANCSGVVGAYSPVALGDNCTANPVVTQTPAASTPLNGHNDAETVTLAADDGNGNTAFCTFTVTLKDITPPTVTCPANTTLAADANCSGVVGAYAPLTVGDNCTANPAVSQSPAASTVLNGHNDVETVTLTADDGNGNTASCSFSVTLKDVTPPTIVCPANTTLAADANCSGVVGAFAPVLLADNCTANPVVTQNPAASTLLIGHNDVETVTLTADDGNGNTASCSFSVTLKDVTPPTIVCPANTTVSADANCSGVVGAFAPVTLSDNCAANPVVTQSPQAATVLSGHNDSETVTLTANDGNGNTASCNFTVTLKDVTPPTITCPANITLAASANCSGVVGAYDPLLLSDNCAANPGVTQSPPASTVLSGHNDSETVTLTANDGNGNTASCSFTVTLKDVSPPTITCPANTTLAAGSNCTSPLGSWPAVNVADNCNANPAVTQSPAGSTLLSGHNDVETVTLTANDGNGNTASCSFTVTLKDVTPPTVVCQPYTAALNSLGAASITTSNVFQSGADNCGTVNQVSVLPNAFTCSNLGANTVVLTVNDGNGNTATCNAVVTVVDLIPPTMLCQPLTIALNASGNATVTAAQINNGSSDNCTLVNLSLSPTAFTCANLGVNTVTLTGTDQSGNTAICQSTVTVIDLILPTVLCKNATIALNNAGQATLTPGEINNGSFDNCTIVNFTLSQTLFTCANIGANTVTLTGSDQSGNSSQCTAIVTVVDQLLPVANCKNAIANLGPNGTVSVPPSTVDNGSSDNCSFTLSLTPSNFTCANLGANVVTLKATDSSGNTKTCTAVLTVKDVTPPNVLCKNPTIFLDSLGHVTLLPAQVNNGSSDNCTITSYNLNFTQFNCSDIGAPVTVVFKATDQSGNMGTCSSTVTVKDNRPPTAICQNATVSIGPTGTVTVYSAQLAVASFDNCEVWSFTPVAKTYTLANLGTNYLPITVKDWSGNSATCTSIVTVLPITSINSFGNGNQETSVHRSGDLLLYPNPAGEQVALQFELPGEVRCSIRVTDLQGRLMLEEQVQGQQGENVVLLNVSGLSFGLYTLQLSAGDVLKYKRLSIQR